MSWCSRSFEPREALPSAAALPPALLQTLLLSLHHIQCMWAPRVLGAFTPVSGFVCAAYENGVAGLLGSGTALDGYRSFLRYEVVSSLAPAPELPS